MKPFFPPRPGITIYWPFLREYEGGNWVAQRKFNGQRNLIYINGRDQIELWSRHEQNGFEHLNYNLSAEQREWLLGLKRPKNKEIVLDSELLHRKTKKDGGNKAPSQWRHGCRDTIVLFDLLYLDGYLSFTTQKERLECLSEICRFPDSAEPGGRALVIQERLWLAETFDSSFIDHFKEMQDCPEIEGLVLRKLGSKLIENNPGCGQRKHDVRWMVRARKTNNSYIF